MNIILSRKGFDSSAGGCASVIIDKKQLISFPIPENMDKYKVLDNYHVDVPNNRYSDHMVDEDLTYLELLKQLRPRTNQTLKLEGKKITFDEAYCHYDPQIYNPSVMKKEPKYKGLFGQSGAALGHLLNNKSKENVGPGDLFLFFGWFRDIQNKNEIYKYVSKSDKHVIWGWLQIDKIVEVKDDTERCKELRQHPHYYLKKPNSNSIFVATERLSLNPDLPGAGIFDFDDKLVLTKKGMSRSKWNLPQCFKGKDISYHSQEDFKKDYFQSRSRGQEFIVAADEEIMEWVKSLFDKNAPDIRGL